MDISVLTNFLPVLMVIIGVLVALINIIVEVLKKLTWDKLKEALTKLQEIKA